MTYSSNFITAKKCFTVGGRTEAGGRGSPEPYIRLGGAWLSEFGINVGDKLQIVQGKNMIVLMKVRGAD
jgi:hypothetical protein